MHACMHVLFNLNFKFVINVSNVMLCEKTSDSERCTFIIGFVTFGGCIVKVIP